MLKCLFTLTAVLLCSVTVVQAQKREYVIVVHGGAGAMKGLENDSVKAAQYYMLRWTQRL